MALASLGPKHLTLSGAVLDKLAEATGTEGISKVSPTENTPQGYFYSLMFNLDICWCLETSGVDYLASGAEALRAALGEDHEASRKLADALKIFGEKEEQTKELIRKELLS